MALTPRNPAHSATCTGLLGWREHLSPLSHPQQLCCVCTDAHQLHACQSRTNKPYYALSPLHLNLRLNVKVPSRFYFRLKLWLKINWHVKCFYLTWTSKNFLKVTINSILMVQLLLTYCPLLRTDWDSGPGLPPIRTDYYFTLLKQPMFFVLMWIIPQSVLFPLWVVVVLQDFFSFFFFFGLDQWWQCGLWSRAAAFVLTYSLMSYENRFHDKCMGEMYIFFT